MDLAGCTVEAVVCDDTGTVTDWTSVVVLAVVGLLVLSLCSFLLWRFLRRPPVYARPGRRVWVSADGEVMRVDGPERT